MGIASFDHEDTLTFMLDRFGKLLARVSGPEWANGAPEIFNELVNRYNVPGRRYHNFHHIEACLRQFDTIKHLIQNPEASELALLFHDAIYDTHEHNNEALSAQLAVATLGRFNVPAAQLDLIQQLILATRHNAPPDHPDAAWIVDIDLCILGQDGGVFDEYEKAIRAEYAWVPEQDYRAGRLRVLQMFIDRPKIYHTEHYSGMLETRARDNLRRSIGRLNEGSFSQTNP